MKALDTGGPAESPRAKKLGTPRVTRQCPRPPHSLAAWQRPHTHLMGVGSPGGVARTPTRSRARQDEPLLLSKVLGLVPPCSFPRHKAARGGVVHGGGGKNCCLKRCLLLIVIAWIPLMRTVSLVKGLLQLFVGICLP